MSRILCLLLILALTPTLALAGLGDTESQCLEKFGSSVKQTAGSGVGEKLVFYERGGVGIGVEFWNSRASCLFYKKTVRNDGLSDAEIEAFLAESREDSYWEGAHMIGEGRRWARKDGKAVAHYNAQQKLLMIMTDAFAIQRMRNKPPLGR